MGKLRNFLFPTKENSVFETTTIVDKDQVNTPKTSSATLITNPEKEIEKKSGMEENSFNAKTGITPKIYKPLTFSEVELLANELLNHQTIIVSLLDIEKSEARRICDFLNGVCFALNGEVKKIEQRVYLFSPHAQ